MLKWQVERHVMQWDYEVLILRWMSAEIDEDSESRSVVAFNKLSQLIYVSLQESTSGFVLDMVDLETYISKRLFVRESRVLESM